MKTVTFDEVKTTIETTLVNMRSMIDPNDTAYILAYASNGLCIGFTADHKPFACDITRAEVVATPSMPEDAWAFTPQISNGHGEKAQVIPRQTHLTQEIARTEELLAFFTKVDAEEAR